MPFVRLLVDLLLLRRGPQDMPGGSTMLYGSAAAYCILLFAQTRIVAASGSAFLQALVSTVALALYVRALLRFRGYPARAPQTCVALFAVGAVFTLLSLGPTVAMAPFLLALGSAQTAADVPQPSAIAAFAGVAIACWSLAVIGHIYRHALHIRFWQGLLVAIGFEFVLFLVFRLLAPLLT